MVVSMTLLKTRVLQALKRCHQNLAVLRESKHLPTETFDQIEDSLLKRVLEARWDSMSAIERLTIIDTLSAQVDQLYKAVDSRNSHFWPGLLSPAGKLDSYPEYYSQGGEEAMELALRGSLYSWTETPGAIDFIGGKRVIRVSA